MIISHSHNFIFFKPTKVAGTSVEVNLAKQCTEGDIVTIDETDKDIYKEIARPHPDFYNHMAPIDIRRKVGEDVWRSYKKITIIRNPWDLCVSRYWWEMSHSTGSSRLKAFSNTTLLYDYARQQYHQPRFWRDAFKVIQWKFHTPNPPHDFETYLKLFPDIYTNTRFYLDKHGAKHADIYLRFEYLEEDYRDACAQLNIAHDALPRLKINVRKNKKRYTEYYSPESARKVERLFSKELKVFPYSFNQITD